MAPLPGGLEGALLYCRLPERLFFAIFTQKEGDCPSISISVEISRTRSGGKAKYSRYFLAGFDEVAARRVLDD